MAALEAAAKDGNEDAFVAAKHRIDWSQRPAPDWIRAVRLGLAAGAHMAARKLASEGAAQYPNLPISQSTNLPISQLTPNRLLILPSDCDIVLA